MFVDCNVVDDQPTAWVQVPTVRGRCGLGTGVVPTGGGGKKANHLTFSTKLRHLKNAVIL